MQISKSKFNLRRSNGTKAKRIGEHQGLSKHRRVKQSKNDTSRSTSKDDPKVRREEQCDYRDDDINEEDVCQEVPGLGEREQYSEAKSWKI